MIYRAFLARGVGELGESLSVVAREDAGWLHHPSPGCPGVVRRALGSSPAPSSSSYSSTNPDTNPGEKGSLYRGNKFL